jgi:hypothetical protein
VFVLAQEVKVPYPIIPLLVIAGAAAARGAVNAVNIIAVANAGPVVADLGCYVTPMSACPCLAFQRPTGVCQFRSAPYGSQHAYPPRGSRESLETRHLPYGIDHVADTHASV